MDQQKKKRSENWSTEEKDILRELIAQSRSIIEDKSTKSSSNIKKAQEWKNIAQKVNVAMGKNRSASDVKLAWKRMKLAAKANLSAYKLKQMQTGGGEKPKSPLQEDLAVMDIAPQDFIVEYNNYDSDAMPPIVQLQPPDLSPECNDVVEVIMEQDPPKVNVVTAMDTSIKNKNICGKKGPQNKKVTIQESILESNTEFKRKQLEMLEVEHEYNITIAKLKIKKLELEIEVLEKRKNESHQTLPR